VLATVPEARFKNIKNTGPGNGRRSPALPRKPSLLFLSVLSYFFSFFFFFFSFFCLSLFFPSQG